ncbi:putative transcriptional regulator [Arcobacter acticola]|uniref:Putative transcriptional regulator n=1 Tax=Arcobacter acticola TaxID=1849015 RepID=A0A6M8ED54_9BACT|nr:helix-turn-helix domain-containing protein [Arcobacter acticola]QKE28420.1 putative transcriptional regulator [Arcobacter acticola]
MNNSILFLSENLYYIEKFKEQSNKNYAFHFLNYDKFYLLNKGINTFDLIIFDNSNYSLIKFKEILEQFENYDFNIPIIILQNKTLNDLSIYKEINTYAILEENISENILITNIEICLSFLHKNKKIQFENRFYFDINKKILFEGKKIIDLTNIEKKLIILLTENANNVINYEDISKEVWKGKKFSLFTLRNTVKHIREKTYETFIQNSSKKGYRIDIYN